MIEIKRNGDIFFAIEDICEGSKFSRQLMDHHYIILKFSTEEPVYFEIGDSVEIPGFGYYELTSAYFPKYNEETDGYDYEMQMDAYYMSWKNKICKYRPKFGANETTFKLTTTVDVHLNVILGNLKALGLKYNGKDFSVDYTTYNKDVFDIQKRFFVSYDSISIIEALNSICSEDALDCEWWIDGSIIYLGYCEMVGQVTFEQGVNMLTMSQSESKSSFITRLYAFGSDKNIPPGYFTGSDADVTTDGVATDYLMLPNKEVDKEGFFCKNGYLENVNVVKNDKQAIEGVVMFDDEYPKVSCAVSCIKTYDSTVKNDDGTNTTETFWQVTSTDSFATNFKKDWIKRNLNPMIKFESGALLGMEFEVNFKIIDNKNYFEIVANEDYGRKLPDKVMCPKIGDKFFLYNWDATKVTETNLIQEAQESLFERAKTYYNKSMIDNSNFSCVMDGKKFFNYGTFDYHPLGEQVKLISPMFADIDENGKHYRNSRIIGIEINLDIPYDSPEYTIGEKASYSRLGQLEDKVDSITVNGLQIGGDGNGGKGVYVIGMNDSTPESDSNVYSSRRTRYSFLSKLNDDTAQGLITFLKGLKSQDVIKAINGISLGYGENYVNGNGDANLSDVIVDRIHDKNSTPSDRTIIGAQGFDLYMGDDGKSHLYVDYLTARTRMFASSVEIRKVSYSGGTTIFSNAGSQIAKVSYIYDAAKEKVIAYKCYAAADDGTTKTMNWWHVGMMALCQTFNVKAGESEDLANRYYWRLVVGVGQEKIEGKLYDYVILSNVKEFQGNLLTVPSFADKTLANEQSKKLVWGNVMVEVTMDKGMQTLASLFAEQEGTDVDDNGNKIADRIFYGYDGDEEPDAPAPFDVIVQVGDQIQWKKYGNVIKLSTSTEDNATDNDNDNAPAITMYHKLGAPHYTGSLDANGNKIINPYQWKIITTIISPEKVMHNTDNFQLFQGTPDNIVDPITIMYDIVPSVAYYTRHPSTQTTTPTDITFSLRKRTGNKVETLTDAQIYAEYTLLNGSSATKLLSNKALSYIGNLYQITSVKIKSTIKEADHEDVVVTYDLPVLTDGVKGDQGAAGKDGTNGIDGKDGKTPAVVSTTYQYAITATSAKPADSEWKSVMPDPSKYEGKFLWTKTTTTWSTGDKTDTFSCTYIGTDGANGTSVTIKGTFGSISELPTTGTAGDGYIIGGFLWIYTGTTTEDANNHNGYTNVGKIKGEDGKNATQYYIHTAWMKDANGTGFTVANPNGDAYPYVGTLVDVNENDSTNWRDYKWTYVKGATGAKGDKGADGVDGADGRDGLDALEVTIKNAPLVFDTDDNGVVKPSTIQNAEIWARRDGENVIADIKNAKIIDSLNFNVGSENAIIRKTSECLQVSLKGIGIAKESVNGSDVSKTGGYVVVSFDDGTNQFSRQIAFSVNVSRFNSSVIQTAKLYERKYTEVSNKYDALPEEVRDKASFTEYNSAIKQTAREISLSVTEEAAKKRNLLVNSDFVRNGGFYIFQTLFATIERYDSLNDENVWYSYPTNQVFYSKLIYEGSKVGDIDRGSHNIPIVIGKKYTISCWAKVSDTSVPLTLQVYSQAAQTGNSATASKGDLLNQEVPLDAANVWQLISFTFEAKGDYSYCSVRLYFQPLSSTRIKGYISQPMLEQADSYNGWTLAEEDYVYRNGNVLDNTRYLDVGGNLTQVGTIINNAKDNCSMSEANVDLATTARRTGTLLRYKIPLEAHTDYVLSFYVRSKDLESKQNVICTINLESGVFFAEGYMQTENESVGYISNYTSLHGNSPTSGYMQFSSIPQDWTKVCYHFSLNSKNTALPISILAYAQNGAGALQICQPKLEKAVTNTAWTEAKQDVAFKDKYKRAGIDLDAETIRLSAERTIIDGDLHLKGILIENSAEISYDPQQPIICDMVHHKSVSFRTWKKEINHPTWMNGININPYVVLPMINDVALSATDAHGELIVHGIKESGMKLTISSQYNPLVAKWATGKKYQYNDRYSMENQEGKPYEFLHRAVVVVFADPRLASVNNYNDSNTGRIHPQGGGVPPFFGDAKYDGGCFICNGRRSRMLFLMPGQSLHLTSSIERIGNSDVVVWYIDNSNDFTPISKTVTIMAQFINGSDGYDWGGENEDKSFPDDRLNGSVGYRYEDVLLAPPQLSATYPEHLPSEALGTNSVSQVPFVFNVY